MPSDLFPRRAFIAAAAIAGVPARSRGASPSPSAPPAGAPVETFATPGALAAAARRPGAIAYLAEAGREGLLLLGDRLRVDAAALG